MTDERTFAPGVLHAGGRALRYTDLPALLGARLGRMPLVLRHLLENVVRHTDGAEREAAVAALLAWLDTGTSEAEIPFQPGRVLMHDTTSTPALVDIAAMRDALAEAGVDPTRLNPRGHVQHRHMKLRISATGSMDVLMRAIVAGVTAPADGALGGRLFGWSVGLWPAGAPIPMITSPDGGKTSQARFTLQGRFPGHYVIVAARPNGGHIGYPLDVEVIP